MIDHINVRVKDFRRALTFYRAALAPLGYKVVMEFPEAAGLGEKGMPDFWISRSDQAGPAVHVAFKASREAVAAFHAAAVAAGGTDNGGPGVRPDYHPSYYGAFIIDPDGNNIEAVCHDPPGPPRGAATRKKPTPRKLPRGARRTAAKNAPAPPPARKKPRPR
jgi:catechol 2,3-dioxygenase-like lactoylglutathione lyase family enzyme